MVLDKKEELLKVGKDNETFFFFFLLPKFQILSMPLN